MVTNKRTIWNIGKEIFAWVLSLLILIPIVVILFNALKTSSEAINMSIAPPSEFHWENFGEVWRVGNILRSYVNSLIVSVFPVLISVLCASMCAYVLARRKTKGNLAIYTYFALGLMFPISMVTVVKVTRILGIYNTQLGVVLVYTALILPLSVFLFYGFLNSIPKELDEAAIVDGAGALRIFFQVIFPMLKPVTVTVIMINFLNCWNEFTIPLYMLPDPDKAVVVQQVYNFYGTFTASWNLVSVTILYAIVPVLAVYICGQKYIISGMVAGAVKG
ncbi:carbohydrate ABC transporter permease [Diplocloster modestus]|uniref:Carbohydrate ABC transporter permease n=1 Tax=Diplocloster modestus TaxID=2850322 RepID=A0ABS6K825_9FIRM|nr:carbohydrate ABC transporter permease [Diplocloster modestus]MBU9726662.1 carbohydrate ABC transporter permease [Diplocloster modestus]